MSLVGLLGSFDVIWSMRTEIFSEVSMTLV